MSINDFIITETETMINAMKKINSNGHGIVFICDQGKLKASISDGDIRRHLMSGGTLNCGVNDIANLTPIYLVDSHTNSIMDCLKKNKISAVPVLNGRGEMIRIVFRNMEQVLREEVLDLPVVIMAGGKGTRLLPFTNILPKPLIPVGRQTITEQIMDNFESFGCHRFYLIVNYKKELIKAYFRELEKKKDIEFIEEREFLGTGGGLFLLKEQIAGTFFLSNCDILIQHDYGEILQYHREQRNIVTIVCVEKRLEVPYGVIEKDDTDMVTGFLEKPSYSFLTNTGFYVIEKNLLNHITKNMYIDMTDIIKNCLDVKERVGIYKVNADEWKDVGQMKELDEVRREFEEENNIGI